MGNDDEQLHDPLQHRRHVHQADIQQREAIARQSVTFTATLAASIAGAGTPGGTVTFKNGSATLGTVTLNGGKAVFSTASLARGAHTITTTYNGSSTFNSHVSPGLTVTVQ